jgi:hypothetical protein
MLEFPPAPRQSAAPANSISRICAEPYRGIWPAAEWEWDRIVFTRRDKLVVARGVRLAQHAYCGRTGREPGSIVEARFEQNDAVLAEYDADQLVGAAS